MDQDSALGVNGRKTLVNMAKLECLGKIQCAASFTLQFSPAPASYTLQFSPAHASFTLKFNTASASFTLQFIISYISFPRPLQIVGPAPWLLPCISPQVEATTLTGILNKLFSFQNKKI